MDKSWWWFWLGWGGRSNPYVIASFWSTLYGSRLRLKATWSFLMRHLRKYNKKHTGGMSERVFRFLRLNASTYRHTPNKSSWWSNRVKRRWTEFGNLVSGSTLFSGGVSWRLNVPFLEENKRLLVPFDLLTHASVILNSFNQFRSYTSDTFPSRSNEDYTTYIPKCPNVQAQII